MPKKKKKLTFEEYCEQRSTYFNMVTHDMDCAKHMFPICLDCKTWAYIHHDPDSDDGTEHYHFLVSFNGSRTVKFVADKFGIPANYVQPTNNVVSFRRYMLHLDSEDKIQYRVEDVKCNCHTDFRSAMKSYQEVDSRSIFTDYLALRNGSIDPEEFIVRNQIFIDKMTFYQKLNTIDKIYYIWGQNDPNSKNANAST